MKPRVVFINPPSPLPQMRDYYCTSVSKAGYAWHPAEFLFQSGVLAERFDVEIVDAIAEKLDDTRTRARVLREPVDLLFGLVGAATPDDDARFLLSIPARLRVASGEVVQPDPAEWLARNAGFDAAMGDFSCDGLLAVAEGASEAPCLAVRSAQGISCYQPIMDRIISIPRPRHELFSLAAYSMPLQKFRPFASLLTDYGCPHRCAFCNSGTLGYRRRAIDGVAEEMDALRFMGIREIFLKNMSFGAHAEHARAVLSLFEQHRFSWHAYARVSDMNVELIRRMAACGCHLLQIGIEHVDEKILHSAGKNYSEDDIRSLLHVARKSGVDAGLHVVLGLPCETETTLKRLERFLSSLDGAVYLSVNLYAPRRGSRMERERGGGGEAHDSTRGSGHGALPVEQLRTARRRMIRAFYANPRRVGRIITKMNIGDLFSAAKGLIKG